MMATRVCKEKLPSIEELQNISDLKKLVLI